KVAYPSMKKFGYSDRLAAGVVAGGGTLGIMIPPSTIMVIYGIFTETNIGKLFAAGIVPGIVGAILLCGAVQYMTWRDPASGPRGERSGWHERLRALKEVWAVGALFLFVMGGIYGGLFTATEGAAMGAFGAMIFALIVHLGFDPIWFGIIIVCVVEIGLISPPVGMNMFVLRTLIPELSTATIFSGVLPFMWADVLRLAILVAFPWLALWLPSMMR